MQKTFESFIILIIFYGVYSAFVSVSNLLWERPSSFWVIVSSLVISGLILMLYSWLVRSHTHVQYQDEIFQLKQELQKKDKDLSQAFKIKHQVEQDAEESISQNKDLVNDFK